MIPLRKVRGIALQYLVSGKEMKLLDQNTSSAFHVPELVLMEQAAMAFVRKLFLLQKEYGKTIKKALILCGSGNNGADGLAIARLLMQQGIAVCVCLCGEHAGHSTTVSYKTQKSICQAYEIRMEKEMPQEMFDLVIDALFGIGLSRNIEGELADVIRTANALDAWKVSVDISSGVHADDGAILNVAFAADDTITFSFGKVGQYLWPGNEASGRVSVVLMGITQESWLERKPHLAALEEKDLFHLLPKRTEHSNKGTYGKLLVIAGSLNMAGAAVMCARAAYRCGTGLVKVLTAEENRLALQTQIPEAILATYGAKLDEAQVIEELKWAEAVVLGPGIGTEKNAGKLVSLVLKNCAVPLLLDADALNILAKEPEQLLRPHTDMIVTPHLGEMARLTGDAVSLIQTRLVESAFTFAQTYNVVCVLKDFHTVTAIPYALGYLNLSGNSGMATAGSGDVLSGIIGAFLAQGMTADHAAPLGVYIHGLAGDYAAKEKGGRALIATDLIEALPKVFEIEK